jgi:transcriptional regulator with XRE-family HTH domain
MIGEKLKELRKLNNISLRSLSEKSGISKSTLSDIENNKTNPTTNTLKKIAAAFNIDVEDLFKAEPITDNDLEKWDKNSEQVKEEVELYETGEFKTAEAAMQFILKQPAIMGYGGFDAEKLSKEEIIEFANELLNQLQLLGLKYKK